MTTTAIGVAIPRDGMARQVGLSQGPGGPEIERSFYRIDPLQVRSTQPDRIPVDWRHTHAVLGQVVSLQLRGSALWATAELDGDPPADDAPPVYWSVASDSHRDGTDAIIRRVAVVEKPAMIAMTPIRFLAGELSTYNVDRWRAQRLLDANLADALGAAAKQKAERRSGPIDVVGRDRPRFDVNPWDPSAPMPVRSRAHPGGDGFWVSAPGRILNVR